jgi:hypothetical protein
MNPNKEDHDLLVELRTEMRGVRSDIKDLKEGTTARIQTLERDKADRKEVEELQKHVNDNIETRVRNLEEAKIEPIEHKNLLKSDNNNGIYLKWVLIVVGLMFAAIIFHLTGYRI